MIGKNKIAAGAAGFSIIAFILIAVLSAGALQRTSDPKYPLSGNGMLKVSPADLGVNALTEPGSGTSAASNIIDLTGARAFTLKFSCTQGNITLNVQTYAEDGTTALASGAVLSAVAASTNTDFYLATEQDTQSTSGTIGTKFRLPQKAISFTFTNASVTAGTCTARLVIVY